MIVYTFEALVILACLSGVLYLLYLLVTRIKESKRKKQKDEQDRIEAVKFLQFGEAKVVVLDHAEKLSQARGISVDEAILIVLSSDYLPGVGMLTLPEDNQSFGQPPTQRAKAKENDR